MGKIFWARLFQRVKEAGRDLSPIIAVIIVFQLAILRQPFPELLDVLMGAILVVAGLVVDTTAPEWYENKTPHNRFAAVVHGKGKRPLCPGACMADLATYGA